MSIRNFTADELASYGFTDEELSIYDCDEPQPGMPGVWLVGIESTERDYARYEAWRQRTMTDFKQEVAQHPGAFRGICTREKQLKRGKITPDQWEAQNDMCEAAFYKSRKGKDADPGLWQRMVDWAAENETAARPKAKQPVSEVASKPEEEARFWHKTGLSPIWIEKETLKPHSKQSFNDAFQLEYPYEDENGNTRYYKATDEARRRGDVVDISDWLYRPDLPPHQVFRDDDTGDLYGNKFDDRAISNIGELKPGTLGRFLKLAEPIYRNAAGDDWEALLDWQAAVYVRRRLIGTAAVITGKRGVGKSTISRVLEEAIGESNCKAAKASDFKDAAQFNSHVRDALYVKVDDFTPSKNATTRGLINGLLSPITEAKVSVDAKFETVDKPVRNFGSYMINSNNLINTDSPGDRRFLQFGNDEAVEWEPDSDNEMTPEQEAHRQRCADFNEYLDTLAGKQETRQALMERYRDRFGESMKRPVFKPTAFGRLAWEESKQADTHAAFMEIIEEAKGEPNPHYHKLILYNYFSVKAVRELIKERCDVEISRNDIPRLAKEAGYPYKTGYHRIGGQQMMFYYSLGTCEDALVKHAKVLTQQAKSNRLKTDEAFSSMGNSSVYDAKSVRTDDIAGVLTGGSHGDNSTETLQNLQNSDESVRTKSIVANENENFCSNSSKEKKVNLFEGNGGVLTHGDDYDLEARARDAADILRDWARYT